MKVLGKLCQCHICFKSTYAGKKKGFWYPCGCQIIEPHPNLHNNHPVQGVEVEGCVYPIVRVVNTGGRCALWIYLEDNEFFKFLPAKQVGQNIEGQVVARFPASIHGCYKIELNKEIVIWRPSN